MSCSNTPASRENVTAARALQLKEGTAFLHGEVALNKLNPLHKWMIKKVESPLGDFRDWDAVTSWAAGIAAVLKEEDPESAEKSD